MTVTNEGLRIELLESASGTFFESGSAKTNSDGRDILVALAHELGKLPNKIYVEGHTDSKPYIENSNYTNWELSADRANATRKLIQQNGVRPDQVTQVRGFADQSLRKPDAPLDPSNRRVSMIVQYLVKKPGEDAKPAPQEGSSESKSSQAEPAKPPAAEH
jgi:chemotaxis protein MotB